MRFLITSTSEDLTKYGAVLTKYNLTLIDGNLYVTINTLEELIDLMNKCDQELIIGKSWWYKDEPMIEIYDTYRE